MDFEENDFYNKKNQIYALTQSDILKWSNWLFTACFEEYLIVVWKLFRANFHFYRKKNSIFIMHFYIFYLVFKSEIIELALD